MASVLRLPVNLGVEVHVVQHHHVRPRQVEALAAGPRGEQEDEDTLGGVVELVNDGQTVLNLCMGGKGWRVAG